MYRVLLRVVKICIHIKESLELQIVLKKNNDNIVAKHLYRLVQGVAEVDLTNEFLIQKTQPSFQLHINFTLHNKKRNAGFVLIDLHDWNPENSYQQIRTLQNCPGGKAIIQFGFIYFDSGLKYMDNSFLSIQKFQKKSNKQQKNKIEHQNNCLTQKLKILNSQKDQLDDRRSVYSKVQNELQKIETIFTNQVSSHENRMNYLDQQIREQQQKKQFLMDLIRSSGSMDLIYQMEGLNEMQAQPFQKKRMRT